MRGRAEAAPFAGSLFYLPVLLERAADRSELVVQCRAEVIDDGDDRQRDTRRDQPVFNRGGTTFICHEALENGHSTAPALRVLCRLT